MRLRPSPSRLAPLTLGLALWTGLPSLEWCPISWDECRAACEGKSAAAPAAVRCDRPCDAASAAAAPCNAAAQCPPTASCAIPCDREPDPIPAGDRAWCVRPPADGILTRGGEVSQAPTTPGPAFLIGPPAPAPPARIPSTRARREAPIPALALPHTPPQSRAPPLGLPADLI